MTGAQECRPTLPGLPAGGIIVLFKPSLLCVFGVFILRLGDAEAIKGWRGVQGGAARAAAW